MKKLNQFAVLALAALAASACSVSAPSSPNPFEGMLTTGGSGSMSTSAQNTTGVSDSMRLEELPYGTAIRLTKDLNLLGGKTSKAGVTLVGGEQQPVPGADKDIESYCILQPSSMNREMLAYKETSITIKAGQQLLISKAGQQATQDYPPLPVSFIQLQPNGFDYVYVYKSSMTANQLLKLCFGNGAVYELPKK